MGKKTRAEYKEARQVKLGPLIIGGSYPVALQTMWKDRLGAIDGALLARIDGLKALGCDILRFAVPDEATAETLGELATKVDIPLVADIHFDYKIALKCLDYPIAKLRINPGNIGARWKVEEVAKKAADKGVPIRIGVNAGSLPAKLRGESDRAGALVKAAEDEIGVFESLGFSDIVVSLKASSVSETIQANKALAARFDYPLHLGVTEAGPLIAGVVKSAIAFYTLLGEGIGSTLRVSLSDSVENEIIAAREIVAESPGGVKGVRIVSCPKCGRNTFDTHAFLARWANKLYAMDKQITVAVMGCAVNGPGESRQADIGITGAGNSVLIFRKGKIVRTIAIEDADKVFEEELRKT